MKQVWKCEYCSEANADSEVITQHESECVFNPEYKGCFTCEHSYWYFYIRTCNLKLDTLKGEEQGNCTGYEKEE